MQRKAADDEPTEPCANCGEMPDRITHPEYGVRYWGCWCQDGAYMPDVLAWDAEQRRLKAQIAHREAMEVA